MFGQQSMNTPTEALLMLKAGDGADVSTEGVSCSARMATKAGGAPQMSDSGTRTSVEDDRHGRFDDPEEGKATYGVAEQPTAKMGKRTHARAADIDGNGPGSSLSSYSSTNADVGASTKAMASRQGPEQRVGSDHQTLVPAPSYILPNSQSRGAGSAAGPVQSQVLARPATGRGRKRKISAEGGSQSARSPPAFLSRRGATGKRPLPTAKTRNSDQEKPPKKREAAARPTSPFPEPSSSEQKGAQGGRRQETGEREPSSLPDPGPLLHALLFPPTRVDPPGAVAIPSEQLGRAIGARFADHVLIPLRDFVLFRQLLAHFNQGPPVATGAWPLPGHPSLQTLLQRRPLVPTAQASAAVPAQRPFVAAQAPPQRAVASRSLPKRSVASRPSSKRSFAPKSAASRTPAPQPPRALLQSPPQHYPPSFPPIQPRPGASLESHCPVKEDKDKKHPVDWDEVADEDVLFGRGGITNTHVGNRYFRSLVDQFVAQYSVTQRGLKRGVATSLVASVRAYGGRFLKQDEKSKHWYEVGDEKAIEKATQSLREGVAREKINGEEESSLKHASS